MLLNHKKTTMRYFFSFTFCGCLFACYFLSQPINAQSFMVPEKGWSVITGVNFTDFYRHNIYGSPKIGIDANPIAGAFLQLSRNGSINSQIGYECQLSYAQQINDLKVSDSGGIGGNIRGGKFTFDQFTLSFLPTLSIGDRWHLTVGIGPVLGMMTNREDSLLFSSHSWRYSSVAPPDTEIIVENQHFFKSIYWGMKTTIDLVYPIKESIGIKLQMGYDWGLNDRAKATLVSEKISSRTTTVGVGLCLELE